MIFLQFTAITHLKRALVLTLGLLCAFSQLCGKEIDDDNTPAEASPSAKGEKPPDIGNFALPTSQQPAALFGFGGNIIDKGEIQGYCFYDDFEGKCKALIEAIPGVVYGVTETFSVFFNEAFTPLVQDGCQRSSGLEDFPLQLEYAFYTKSTKVYVDQATIVANMTFPTGVVQKNPPTGFGAPTFFIGGTYYRTTVDWVLFTAQGAILPTSHRGTRFGNQLLYQFGIARNVPSPKGYIYCWMIELDGQYYAKNRIKGKRDPNSGGNVIYITPSIWFSSKRILMQFGVSLPIQQKLFGKQRKFNYALNCNIAISFYGL